METKFLSVFSEQLSSAVFCSCVTHKRHAISSSSGPLGGPRYIYCNTCIASGVEGNFVKHILMYTKVHILVLDVFPEISSKIFCVFRSTIIYLVLTYQLFFPNLTKPLSNNVLLSAKINNKIFDVILLFDDTCSLICSLPVHWYYSKIPEVF